MDGDELLMPDDAGRLDFGDLGSADAAALDGAAVELGVGILQLMEVAGFQVARCGWELLGGEPAAVAVVAGGGNNGGDGLVAARLLTAWGCSVHSVVVGDADRLGDAVTHQLAHLRRAGGSVAISGDGAVVPAVVGSAALVVDALLGTGLRQPPRPAQACAIAALGPCRVLAVDVPSGLSTDSGEPLGECVTALATCTLTAVKRGLWSDQARILGGELWAADIGMPAAAWERLGRPAPRLLRGGALLRVPTRFDPS